MKKTEEHLFIKACLRQSTGQTPIWIMRQAGRYLPEYRAVREKYDFLTMCRTPELAAEVTIQPITRFGFDAAIIFSDILVVPEAMGMKLNVIESKGPVFEQKIESLNDIEKLDSQDIVSKLDYVFQAVKLTKERLEGNVPLIGFAGAPWTLASYMAEGGGSKNFAKIKGLIYNNPGHAHKLLEKLSKAIIDYLNTKIDYGCDAVQIFDTWAGILSPHDFREFSLKYIAEIAENIKKRNIPVIVFAKGIKDYSLLADVKCDVIGVDWQTDLSIVKQTVNQSKALQGNLDPVVLLSNAEKIKEEALKIMQNYGNGSGHIFNLGHGILPETPVENVKALVDYVKTKSREFHG
jgi:uroporphyrinogen decarboxylase